MLIVLLHLPHRGPGGIYINGYIFGYIHMRMVLRSSSSVAVILTQRQNPKSDDKQNQRTEVELRSSYRHRHRGHRVNGLAAAENFPRFSTNPPTIRHPVTSTSTSTSQFHLHIHFDSMHPNFLHPPSFSA